MDLAITDVCVSGDFMRGHSSTKTDDGPLDRFRDRLTPSHHGGGTISAFVVINFVRLW